MKPNILHSLTRLCPICDSHTSEVLRTQRFVLPEGHPQAAGYNVVCCAECGFAFALTDTSQEDYDEFYATFSKYTDRETSVGGGELAWDAGRLQHTAADIARFVPNKDARIVDIGCAGGGLLRALHNLGYTNLCGIDPALSCVTQTNQVPGVTAHVGSISQIPEALGPFDCIVLSHVLEHIRDLQPALEYLRTRLKPDGYLYVETPDATRYAEFMFAPFQDFSTEHINYFSLISMSNLLQRCGFAPTRFGTKLVLLAPNVPYPALFVFAAPSTPATIVEKDDGLKASLIDYITVSRRMLYQIDDHLRSVLELTPEVLVWGTGQLAMKLLAETSLARAKIVAFIDSNPINQGMLLRGVPVLSPSQIRPSTTPIIVASTMHYRDICESIRRHELSNPVIALQAHIKTQAEQIVELEDTLKARNFEHTNAMAFVRSHEGN